MQLQCPNCAKPLEVPDSSAGAVVSCPACNGQMQVPTGLRTDLAPAPAAGSAGQDESKQCPYCGETILKVARKCKYCKTELPDGVDVASVRRRLAAKEADLRARPPTSESAAARLSFWSRFRIGTLVSGGLTLVFAVMFLLGVTAQGDSLLALTVLGVIFGLLTGIAFLAWFAADLAVPGLNRRSTPEKGMAAFVKALAAGRMDHAYACLLAGEKDQTERARKAILEVKVLPGSYTFADPNGFKSYWKGICRSSGGYSRRLVISSLIHLKTKGDYAQVRAMARIESYPQLALLGILGGLIPLVVIVVVTTKRHDLEITKLLRKVGDQWWVVNGELDSPEDGALEVAAQLSAAPSA